MMALMPRGRSPSQAESLPAAQSMLSTFPSKRPPHTPLTTAVGDLLTAGGDVRNQDGDVITYDTVANPLSDPIFDGTGVCFASGFYGYDGGTPEYNALINIWGNGPGSYGMFIGEANVDGNGNVIGDAQWVYVYDETGTMTVTPSLSRLPSGSSPPVYSACWPSAAAKPDPRLPRATDISHLVSGPRPAWAFL